ncbi:MAG: hypothetical protein A2508_02240 [Candidatus Lambdaproteobacteria bacterium RIFOXYD12_FULL_49_8]|uniref:Uncharacterized protein n=1 Tax=Candidatus Lambdaproteobacteria bacterium RIFOXYD2_FULL_50_16 TaxID=1817772 RepID=A0A1F6GEJ6_9PROT|nr:MAG: hypothetical protein A2527_01155 [Candidatus Lambdaproteobacteria bacterium RIFOXYD2_FULL_50_16]OGG97819.1 MAG: hypothetical protein A2508_02240 [Candidatus Lambdaproteobacteria bacterium RIFOXYD12_FULL_49_8]
MNPFQLNLKETYLRKRNPRKNRAQLKIPSFKKVPVLAGTVKPKPSLGLLPGKEANLFPPLLYNNLIL